MESIVLVLSNLRNMLFNPRKVPSSLELCLHKFQGKGNICGGQWEMAGFLLTFLGKKLFFACVIGGKPFSEMV